MVFVLHLGVAIAQAQPDVHGPCRLIEDLCQQAAFSDGTDFGRPGYLRLNFAAPPSVLSEALTRMERAMAEP